MTDQEFNQLLHRFEKGLCTAEEQVRLEQWLDSMKEGESPFKSEAERESIKMALRGFVYEKAGIPRPKSRRFIPLVWMKVAASILILVLAGYPLVKYDLFKIARQSRTVETEAKKEIQKILLADGSIVWIKPNSKLSYPETFKGKERVVILTGEALFEVAKNPESPFIIHTGDLTTRVVGTSFNIKSAFDHTEVYVFTGKVLVSLAKTDQEIELLPRERVVYSHASNRLRKEEDALDAKAPGGYTKGTEYNMYFRDAKVSDIARHIERKFGVKVSVQGSIRSCVITADFTDQPLNNTIDMISEALNASYEIHGNTVLLKGDGCE